MKIRLSANQIQKQILAPSMQQSIEILLLPLAELGVAIEQELENNPMLEIDETKTQSEKLSSDELILKQYTKIKEEDNSPIYDDQFSQEENTPHPSLTKTISLEEYLLEQLKFEISNPDELKIGEFIIGNLDEDGYLKLSVEEIAAELKINDPKSIEIILHKIQNFDPIGIAARDLKECLSLQSQHAKSSNHELLVNIIENNLNDLLHKRYQKIAQSLKIPLDKIKAAASDISTLEPKPARKYWPKNSNIYIIPDVIISKTEENNFKIDINDERVPRLKVSSTYQNMLKSPHLSEEEREFIKTRLRNAVLFIRSISQRHQTIREITQYILDRQKDFFELGPSALKPMILKDVAQAINRNESTVCRAINNKYLTAPCGLYPLKYFFSHSVNPQNGNGNGNESGNGHINGGIQNETSTENYITNGNGHLNGNSGLSSRSLKEAIERLIEEEDKTKPLSDIEIQARLKDTGMVIARRTISKYRQLLNILPSHLRKEV